MARSLPTYTLGKINYRFMPGGKWVFESPETKYAFLYPAKGKDQALRVAKIVNGAVKRVGAMDGLARAALQKI